MGRISSSFKKHGMGKTETKQSRKLSAKSRQVSFGENKHHLIPSTRSDDDLFVSSSSVTHSDDDDDRSQTSSTSTIIPNLHDSLMRRFKKKDPFKYYDVLQVLGDGSMGSVSKVKKRKSALGGSARKSTHPKDQPCFKVFPCLLFCFPSKIDNEPYRRNMLLDDSETTVSTDSGGDSSTIPPSNPKRLQSCSSMVSFVDYGVEYALKSIILDQVANQTFVRELQNEIAILRTLDHPNVCKAIETYDFQKRMYLVLELCSGGDLYTRDPYDEPQAKYVVRSLLDACAYLHKKKIIHRDLKYENVMFASPTSPNVKIIDFGLSKKYFENETFSQTVGTAYTMAPEVIRGKYDQACDVWSIGVITFMLCSSSLPFYGRNRQSVIQKIMKGTWAFKGRRWKEISQDAKDFVTSLLIHDRKERPSCTKALEHAWFHGSNQNGQTCNQQIVSSKVMDRVQATIQTFAGYSKLKKLALYVIAHKSSSDEVGFLQSIFQNRFDIHKDGEITLEEFKDALQVYSYTEDEIESMFHAIDIDGCDVLRYNEFLAATIEAHGMIEEDRIAEAFDRMDDDDTGYITVSNLTDFLGPNVSKEYIDAIIDEVDIKHDHRIDYEEFLALWDGSFDKILEENLKDVAKKRVRRESMCGSSLERTTSEEDEFPEDLSPTADSLDVPRKGAASYFFQQEKAKSMRGEWI